MRIPFYSFVFALGVFAAFPAAAQKSEFPTCPYAEIYRTKGMITEMISMLEGCAEGSGDIDVMYKLGVIYYQGKTKSVPTNYEKAANYFQMAAYTGYAPAQVKLALMYWRGEGVPKNLEMAYMWLYAASGSEESRWYYPASVSLSNKDPNADQYLVQLGKQLNEETKRALSLQVDKEFKEKHLFETAVEVRGILGANEFMAAFRGSEKDPQTRTRLLQNLRRDYVNMQAMAKPAATSQKK